MTLITTPNLRDPDGAYATLLAAHQGLTEAETHALNARLILILMNHIGDPTVLEKALELAASQVGFHPDASAPDPFREVNEKTQPFES